MTDSPPGRAARAACTVAFAIHFTVEPYARTIAVPTGISRATVAARISAPRAACGGDTLSRRLALAYAVPRTDSRPPRLGALQESCHDATAGGVKKLQSIVGYVGR